MSSSIAINTLAYLGYPLDIALGEIARLCEYVEPVFISRYDPSLREEYFTEENALQLRACLEHRALKITAMASHMDLGQPDAAALFSKRIDFAKALGARIILTNATVQSRAGLFYETMKHLAAHAEKLGITIALENPGDGEDSLLGSAQQSIAVLERIDSPQVKLNYDVSNVFTYWHGTRRPDEEINSVLPHLVHLHLKNVRRVGNEWPVCSLREGIIDAAALFRRFPDLCDLPMSIELPVRFGYTADFRFVQRRAEPVPLPELRALLSDSLDYLSGIVMRSLEASP